MAYSRAHMEVNLSQIAENMRIIREKVRKDSKVMAVVKADGYGHGSFAISKTVIENGADYLGVAICEEGVEIRRGGIKEPILILGYTPEVSMAKAIDNNLIQTIYSYEIAEKLSQIAKNKNKVAQIHIKLDTGMARLGYFENNESLNEIKKISCLDNIEITGVYSHFSSSDFTDKTYTKTQYDRFMSFVEKLKEEGVPTGVCHISNSGAVLDLDEYSCDMVRTGIIIYGYPPSKDVNFNIGLKPAMSFKTHISFVKELEAGQSVGYAQTYITNKTTKIATIPVGYADGYSRSLSNRGRVLVNGSYASIIGNICMDQFMVDVTHIENIKIDDEVVLIGRQGENQITVEEIAELENTISYEIICNIGKRVPRIYS